jgi:beta-glucosidase
VHRLLLFWSLASFAALACSHPQPPPPAASTPPPAVRAGRPAPDVAALLAQMTLAEKVGQMTQVDRNAIPDLSDLTTFAIGSVLNGGDSLPRPNTPEEWANMTDALQSAALATRLGIPLIYGTDAVHGNGGVRGAVIFPHNVGLGCTRNPALVEAVARATAEEVAGSGADWTFAPCIAVPRDERWGRTYEGFGETPELATLMAPAAVRGLQEAPAGAPAAAVLACAKHFLADGGTKGGKDQGNAIVSDEELRAIHLPGYVAAVQAGVGSVMVSYSSINGQKMHGNRHLITDVLKGELGFQGFVVTDWEAVNQLPGSYDEQVAAAINAGIDMVMVPTNYRDFITTMTELVGAGKIPLARIDDAVTRILRQKARFGLWERPLADRRLTATVGSAAHRALARRAVRESLVLLKNEGQVLPLRKTARLNVAGSRADDVGAQCGGWTVGWQGKRGPTTPGTSLLAGLRAVAGPAAAITFSGDAAGPEAAAADVNLVVVGEDPYAEGRGDRPIPELTAADEALVKAVKRAGKPVVLVVVTGRPLIVSSAFDNADAIAIAGLPGTEGAGVADVLYGDAKPTGKLSHTWPRELTQIPINFGDVPYDPLYPYGFGLGY